MSFKDFLLEHFINPISNQDKEKYVDEVWDILQASYESIGGLKTNGLSTKEGLIANTKMWKLLRKNGKIIAVIVYKDKFGRKLCALGTDKSKEAKNELVKMLSADLTRSYMEISSSLEGFIFKYLPEIANKYKIPYDIAKQYLKDSIPEKDGYHYTRKIDGEDITKIMLGTLNKKIT